MPPNRAARVRVPVATVWSSPKSPRKVDAPAIAVMPNYREWLSKMTREETIALCAEKRIQTQVLFAEPLNVEVFDREWAKVSIPSQSTSKSRTGYSGWIPTVQLEIDLDGSKDSESVMVFQPFAALTLSTGAVIELSYATLLELVAEYPDHLTVSTPLGRGTLLRNDCLFLQRKTQPSDGPSIVQQANRFLGLPYLWGGMSAYGFDCSGFCYTIYRASGYLIPRDACDQFTSGSAVRREEILPGDLLFFAYENGKGKVHHVGIYMGNQQMIHSPTPGSRIRINALPGTIYERELCGVRRYWKS